MSADDSAFLNSIFPNSKQCYLVAQRRTAIENQLSQLYWAA